MLHWKEKLENQGFRETSFGSTQKPHEPFLLPGGGCRQHRPEPPGKGRGEDHDLLHAEHRDRRDLWPYLWESFPTRWGSQFGFGKSGGKALAQPSVIDTFLNIISTDPFESLAKGEYRSPFTHLSTSWNTWGCGSSNQDPLPRSMPHLPDTSGILSFNSPWTTITFIVAPTTPGVLTFSRKDQEYGAGGTGVPGWASKPPNEPRPIVESVPSPPLTRKFPGSPLRRPPNKPKILC